ncbi:SDR family NAD(P)-dependent oxidoreductase [Nitrospirillum sp. BR 11828]|uniref:SDR family NAD(P)-dependent oxidoreductase n=1 Tax=Nitrospirillum sp. BR 11828 TaxID=3104325 RepID=UPI002ACAE056|nr:SDR family NAD(P)-dependent oxidoreductase [Nitrospirillum sp. BR 11828]MDZ5649815.1 SDR family NAD(P)-dependent oxidoreductase [Nitrospirillum sp. BR 11828]
MAASRAPVRLLAVVTGASTGIGYELAKLCAQNGLDLVVAADEPEIHIAAETFRTMGVHVDAVEVDLATVEGVDTLYTTIQATGRPVDILFANAGRGLGKGFLDQDFAKARRVIDTNVTGTVYLIHKVGRDMRLVNSGRILITGSIAGFIPGSYQAVYNASKAFLDNFAFALRNELKDTGVTVSCLMPGPTQTEFFRRAELLDTDIGTTRKDDPAKVARDGFDAVMNGQADVVSGWKNKLQATLANITPNEMLAEQHRGMAAPGTARKH